jgi:hypothetical protein
MLCAAFAATFLIGSIAQADDTAPYELTAAQMDQITAGELALPNGRTVFDGFDNPSPHELEVAPGIFLPLHPGLINWFKRGGVPGVRGEVKGEAAWEAHYNSPVIGCFAEGCPPQ